MAESGELEVDYRTGAAAAAAAGRKNGATRINVRAAAV